MFYGNVFAAAQMRRAEPRKKKISIAPYIIPGFFSRDPNQPFSPGVLESESKNLTARYW